MVPQNGLDFFECLVDIVAAHVRTKQGKLVEFLVGHGNKGGWFDGIAFVIIFAVAVGVGVATTPIQSIGIFKHSRILV